MAMLQYNGITLDFCRTVVFDQSPVYDPSGVDLECYRVTIEVQAVVQEFGIATGKGDNGYAHRGNVFARGDVLPDTLWNLRQILLTPRRHLKYWVGTKLVVQSPQFNSSADQYASDVKGGPLPQGCRVLEIIGDRSAIVHFRIETYINHCDNYVLSNRWGVSVSHDEHGYSTMRTSGRAAFRKDFLLASGLVVDDFRRWLILPAEPRFKRQNVNVQVNPQGTELQYAVVDQETNYGTGAHQQISRVRCQVTSGVHYPVRSVKEQTLRIYDVFRKILRLDGNAVIGDVFDMGMPQAKGSVVVQIWGQAGADRLTLFRVAAAVAIDRGALNMGVGNPDAPSTVIAGCFGSVDWSSEGAPFVELRIDFYRTGLRALTNMWRADPIGTSADHFNWNPTIAGAPTVPLNWNENTPRAELPNGDNTGGMHIGRLVAQALASQVCEEVEVPPAPGEDGRTTDAANTLGINSDTVTT